MLGRGSRPSSRSGEASQPLLNDSREDLSAATIHEDVLFSAHDEDDFEHSALDGLDTRESKAERTVRFHEDVQVVGPPLRSTYQSREAGAWFEPLVSAQ